MKENFLEGLSAEEKKRIAYIEGRLDLFETKVLRVQQREGSKEGKSLLVSTRDPGSGNALLPVLKEFVLNDQLQITVITDGRAEEIIKNNFQTEDITPIGAVLGTDSVIRTPDVILIDRSSEMGIEMYVTATFPEVPKILVEDYYANTIPFLTELKRRDSVFPVKICVMDAVAKAIIVDKFPELEEVIEITGQPAFDRFAKEDISRITTEVKRKLGLQPTDKLVSFMATDEPQNIGLMIKALKEVKSDFYFVFRRHPRDNVSYEIYKKALVEAGIRVIDTNDFSTDEIGAASDIVLTTWSTEGLHGIYRRKPTIHITDKDFSLPEGAINFPLPPVKLGASIGVNQIDDIAQILPQLLDPNSLLNKDLSEKMKEQYPADGKNAERVAIIIRQYLKDNFNN